MIGYKACIYIYMSNARHSFCGSSVFACLLYLFFPYKPNFSTPKAKFLLSPTVKISPNSDFCMQPLTSLHYYYHPEFLLRHCSSPAAFNRILIWQLFISSTALFSYIAPSSPLSSVHGPLHFFLINPEEK